MNNYEKLVARFIKIKEDVFPPEVNISIVGPLIKHLPELKDRIEKVDKYSRETKLYGSVKIADDTGTVRIKWNCKRGYIKQAEVTLYMKEKDDVVVTVDRMIIPKPPFSKETE